MTGQGTESAQLLPELRLKHKNESAMQLKRRNVPGRNNKYRSPEPGVSLGGSKNKVMALGTGAL